MGGMAISPWSPADDAWGLNWAAWQLFEGTNNKVLLTKALSWSALAVTMEGTNPNLYNYVDTKANLLYKLGNTKAALELQQKAVSLSSKDPTVMANLAKMKKGQPTWVNFQITSNGLNPLLISYKNTYEKPDISVCYDLVFL